METSDENSIISVPHSPASLQTSEQTPVGRDYSSSEMCPDLRIVLLGKPGVGKSASGNTILGKNVFKTRQHQAAPSKCSMDRAVGGRGVSVVDTPGLCNTDYTTIEVIREIAKCICLSSPGPHAFLVTIQLGRFTEEEQETVKIIQKIFGKDSAKYTMVLFSHGDRLKEQTIDKFVSDNDELQSLIDQCCGRYHVLNNEAPENRSQVTELLQKIDEMVAANGGSYYTNEMYQLAEEEIEKEIMKELKGEPKAKDLRETLENLDKTGKKNTQKKSGYTDSFALKYRLQSACTGAVFGAVTCSLLGIMGGPVGIVAGLVIGAAGGAGLGAGAGPGVRAAADNCSIQ